MFRICVVTTTRAEYGLLAPFMHQVQVHSDMQLQIIATGTHVSQRYGNTYQQIEADGFVIDACIDILEDDSASGILHAMANAQLRVGAALQTLQPQVVVVLGDRFELVPIVSSCVILQIPIAHIHGGEITQGAIDEQFRHAISKMAHLHFPATQEYRKRLIQMGEQPSRVFAVGSLGVEQAQTLPLLTQKALQEELGFVVNKQTILVTFHPVTTELHSQAEQFQALLTVLEEQQGMTILFTRPNADQQREELNIMLDEFVQKHHSRAVAFASLGQRRYFSALAQCGAVVGNSSSGIIEAPSFHIPTINIGSRQQGRMAADSVVHCNADEEAIQAAFLRIKEPAFQHVVQVCHNPYEGASPAKQIIRIVYEQLTCGLPIQKCFYDDTQEGL